MSDEEDLKQLYKEMYALMIRKDTASLSKLLDDSFVLVHMTGMRQSKKQFLDAVENGTLKYYQEDTDEIAVHAHGNEAVVIGKSRVNAAVFGGGRYTWRLEQDLKCRRENGRWTIVSSEASTYKEGI